MTTTNGSDRVAEILAETQAEVRAEKAARAFLVSGDDPVDQDSLKLHTRAEQLIGKTDYTAEEYADALGRAHGELGGDEVRTIVPLSRADSERIDLRGKQILAERGLTLSDVTEEDLFEAYCQAERELIGGRR